jgi:hypothetical protein
VVNFRAKSLQFAGTFVVFEETIGGDGFDRHRAVGLAGDFWPFARSIHSDVQCSTSN